MFQKITTNKSLLKKKEVDTNAVATATSDTSGGRRKPQQVNTTSNISMEELTVNTKKRKRVEFEKENVPENKGVTQKLTKRRLIS